MYTMLICPICHRMFETSVTECAIKVGGCGYIVPQAKPAEPVSAVQHVPTITAEANVATPAATDPAPPLSVADASAATTEAIEHLNHG